ncbi:nuclear transport factor 2 family protein [Prolixibacteraceae bacterium Z1-6]|uniref:Nuclear transport factor 2 family protein n=1 Tax=Draconibacterium aestuarii TaxID=2998507 RepID=A0A9X3J7D5_9BACT|nr:nuclear transport factor 2 family protein [Prolixibacteraceae bacterium Z1-6]
MKNLLITLVAILLCTGINAKEKNSDKEKEAIKKVITEATNAYRARDFVKIASTYVHDESLVKTASSRGGFAVNYGWKKVAENYKNNFKNNPEPAPGNYKKVNFKIKVYEESAWAIHDEIIEGNAGNTYKQVITHFLEKHNDQWKVVYMSNIRATSWDLAE